MKRDTKLNVYRFHSSFSSFSTNHTDDHFRRYMILLKSRSSSFYKMLQIILTLLLRISALQPRACLTRIAKIQHTKPLEHLYLLNRLLQLVLVPVSTSSRYFYWRNFDVPKLMPVEHISFPFLLSHGCFLLNTRQQVTGYCSANKKCADGLPLPFRRLPSLLTS